MENIAAATGPVQTDYISLFALRQGLAMEARGMKLSRGVSTLAIAKRRLGITGSRATVTAALEKVLAEHPGNPRNA